jgi:hypothetical protein
MRPRASSVPVVAVFDGTKAGVEMLIAATGVLA